MANLTQLANDLTTKFVVAENKTYALNKIVYDLNYMIYADTKQPLSYRTKTAVMKYMFDVVAGRKTVTTAAGHTLQPSFADIAVFFERRSFILRQLKAGIGILEKCN